MGMRRPLFLTVLCLSLFLLAAQALAEGETAKFSLLQTFQEGDDILAFSEVLDARGLPVTGLGADNLRVTLGADPVRVRSFLPFGESGEGMAVLFLVDISKSLGKKEFAGIRDSMTDWIGSMGDKDRVSIVAFGEDIRILSEFEDSRSDTLEAVSSLTPTDNLTQLNRAILKSLEIGRRVDSELPARRAVVLVSDGMDDTRGGATREEVLRALQGKGIPLWAVGFHSGKLTDTKKAGLSSLGEMARISRGDVFLVDGKKGFPEAFASLRERLLGTYAARLDCSHVSSTGEPLRLQAVLSQGGRAFTDGREVRFLRALTLKSSSSPSDTEQTEETASSERAAVEGESSPATIGEGAQAEESVPAAKDFPLAAAAGAILVLGGAFLYIRGKSRQPEVAREEIPGPVGLKDEPLVSAPIGRGIPVKLEVVRGPHRGETFDLNVDRPLSVGRAQKGNQLVMKGDLGISGRHMEIFHKEGSLFIRDLRSTNGTFVNGVRIQADHRIQPNDLLLLGGTELRVII